MLCVSPHVSLALLHVFPCFRLLISEMLIEWKLGKMLVREASSPLMLSNIEG
jgi:hypothetical protein